MPPIKKVDRLPEELKAWLTETLIARGFSDYEAVTDELNERCEREGCDLRFHFATVHRFGQEFKDYSKSQKEAQEQIKSFLEEASLQDEVDVTRALFQQLTALQWRLQMEMAMGEGLPDARGMKDLTTALNNLIRSTSLRDAIVKAEHAVQSEKLDAAVAAGGIDKLAAEQARAIMGFA